MEVFGRLEKLTVKALQEILRERGLSTSYKVKADLIERVLENSPGESGGEAFEDSVGEEDPVEEFLGCEEPVGQEDCVMTEQKQVQSNSFVFKDVEESLETFDGESGKDVQAWLKDFHDIATVCQWNDVQRYLYARRLLRGAAKLAVEATTGIHSWELLQKTLKREFSEVTTCISVHRSLEARKKKATETFLEYIYAMKQIASRVTLDDESLISYIIAGIIDDVQNKVILYGAKTLEELKSKIKVYETMKAHQKSSSTDSQGRRGPTEHSQQSSSKRCYNCGVSSHVFRDCPHKDKGAKCFRCGEFGHTAPNCSAQQQSGTNIEVSEVNLIEEKKKGEEEKKKCEEEERRIRQEEEKKKQEKEKKKQEEEKKEQEEAEKKKQEREEKRKRQEEEKRKQEEEEKRKREKEERRNRKVEEKRKREEEEKRKWEEEEKRNREREKEERRKREAEEKRKRKEEVRKQEEERKREEEERKREEEEKKLEEEYKQALKEMEKRHQRKRQSLEEARRVIAEKKKRAEKRKKFQEEKKKTGRKEKTRRQKEKTGRRKERGRRTEVKGRRERKKRKRKKEDRKYSWKKRKPSQNY